MSGHAHRPGRPTRRAVLTAVAEFTVLVAMFAVILLYAFAAAPGNAVTW